MHKFKKLINKHKEIFSFAIFVTTTLAVLTITLILVRTNQDVRSSAATAPCSLTNPIIIDLTEQEFIEILNNHRQTLGAGPLRISENLTKLAQWQAEDMIENNYFNHIDSLGRNYQQRSKDCGVNSGTISENLANGANSATAAFNAWQASTDGHKENMENAMWSQTGIARVASGGQVRWAQTFGTGNDGTTPELEDPNTPTATPTLTPTQTPDPTSTIAPTASPTPPDSIQPTSLPSTSPSLTPIVAQRTVNFSFKIPGIGPNISLGENPKPQPNKLTICITIRDSLRRFLSLDTRCLPADFDARTYLFPVSTKIDESLLQPNNFIVIEIPRGNSHDIIVKSLPQNNPLTIPTLLFRLGDFNNDDFYDLNDYIDLVSCIKKTTRCTNDAGEFYDINLDGAVDSVDLNILYASIRDFNQ